MGRRTLTSVAVSAAALLAVVGATGTASAAPADKPQVLSSFTQTSAASYNAFIAARNNQSAWSAYGFDWSTDYCSDSPDNPLGFPFSLSCARHDFGYRNYKLEGDFTANKPRLDSMLYADLQRVCDNYSSVTKDACDGLAWTYYQAVKEFGS